MPMPDATSVLAGGELRYSTVWEDHLLLERGLAPRFGDDLLVIAGAGDNVLNLLLREPRRIVAIDVNPAQSALVELKLAALSALEHRDFVQLLGLSSAKPRVRLSHYERVRARLGDASRAWWDDRATTIADGITEAGRLDRFIAGFRAHFNRADVDRLLSSRTIAEQRANAAFLFSPELCRAFTEYFSAENLGVRGRDPSQMQYVGDDIDVAAHLLSRLRWVCTELPVSGNVYIQRFLRGIETHSPYLQRDAYPRLRRLASRVDIVTTELSEYLSMQPARSFDHAGLSDLFEYLSSDATAAIADDLARVVRPGGRIAYWNLFVPRALSSTSAHLEFLDSRSHDLWASDRSWFYRAFRVEEVAR
jgi:S-adenosylmethionine-diacylglycerol 3-amino-3-carboxypropyl transferase